MASPLLLTSMPRRSRIVAVVFFIGCLVFLIPRVEVSRDGSKLVIFGEAEQYDVLKFVDPLIGTTNGGE